MALLSLQLPNESLLATHWLRAVWHEINRERCMTTALTPAVFAVCSRSNENIQVNIAKAGFIMSLLFAGTVSSLVQVQLIGLCSRYEGYEAAPAGCNITFANITLTGASPSAASSSPSPVSFDGTRSSLELQAVSPTLQAASPSPEAASPSTQAASLTTGQGATFSSTVAFDRPVVGTQSLQSFTGMMYTGGVTNGGYDCACVTSIASTCCCDDTSADAGGSKTTSL